MTTATLEAGAERSSAPASPRLRTPTFGDWVACGDIQKTLLIADPMAGDGVDATMEFTTDPVAVAAWFEILTGMKKAELVRLPMVDGRRMFADLRTLLPPMAEATTQDRGRVTDKGVTVPLKTPLPGARGNIAELDLRRPVFGDWIECGDPSVQRVSIEEQPGSTQPRKLEQRIDRAAVNRWMLALSGLPEAILHLLDYEDARVAFAHLRAMLAGLDLGN